MKKWSAVLFALMMIVGCGGGGGTSGGSDGSGSGGGAPVVYSLPDNFDGGSGLLEGRKHWESVEDYDGFGIDDDMAKPTSVGINVNVWEQTFNKNQWVSFKITKKPQVENESSVGVLLRANVLEKIGYLVTFVPVADVDDEIRLWHVHGDLDTENDSLVDQIYSINHEFEEGDEIIIVVIDDTTDGTPETKIMVFINDGFPYEVPVPADKVVDQDGYIGIYAVTKEDLAKGGAIDDFDGGGDLGWMDR